jgi:threonine dehydratase
MKSGGSFLETPTAADVVAAAERIRGLVHHTPVMCSQRIDLELDAKLFFKCENQQRGGAFKARGAFNALSSLAIGERSRGVATYSSGNHAQALALAAQQLGVAATIVMPQDAPAIKVAATAEYAVRILRYDRYSESREALCQDLADREGLTVIPPFDHADVIAGQGTAVLELLHEVGDLHALFVPLGGGGLLAGSLLAAGSLCADCRVYGVEPAAGNDGQQSLRRGAVVRIPVPQTIADGAQTQQLGALTFPIIRRQVADILAVTDDDLVRALQWLALELHQVVEPTGCLGFAGALAMQHELRGKRVGVILSGGNVDPEAYARFMASPRSRLR